MIAKRPDLKEIFICKTIHQDDIPSKRVIGGLGDFDTLYVKRRTGINREVYFCKIDKDNIEDFIRENDTKIQNLKNKIENDSGVVFKITEL